MPPRTRHEETGCWCIGFHYGTGGCKVPTALIREQAARFRPEAAGARPTYRDFRAGDVRHSPADVSPARRLLGYEPAVRMREGLARPAEWYAGNLGAGAAAR